MRRAIVGLGAPLVVLVLVAGPAAAASGDFRFFGSGYGHGLGLSQWGAYGLATQGWRAPQILTHYYTGTNVERDRTPPRTLRVGLTQGRTSIHMEARGGPVALRVGDARKGKLIGRIPDGDRWTIRPAHGRYKISDRRGRVVGHRTWGSEATNLYATYADHVFVPEGGNDYNRGYLEVNLTSCGGGCSMRLILVAPLEQYLFGVAEVPSSWPREALRAQADAARSYAIAKVERYGQHAGSCNCGLAANTLDQAYAGWDKEHGSMGDRWVAAVRDTAGDVVTYHGAIIQAFYSASSGGFTENNENVWGGAPIPWLRGVCDPGDYAAANPSRTWKVVRTPAEVTSALRSYTGDIGTVRRFSNPDRGISGRVITVRVQGSSGGQVVTGSELRAGLGLRDDRVWFNEDLNVEGAIRELYDRLNCRPGLPASKAMSTAGGSWQAFHDGDIYRNDHADVTVWLSGALNDEYAAQGGPRARLGLPTSKIQPAQAAGCTPSTCGRVDLEHGAIYLGGSTGAHALWGPVLSTYLSQGGDAGSLGLPTTAVQEAVDGSSSATFEHGTITCDGGGACAVG
jgi:SpoIID/LytB domain protein